MSGQEILSNRLKGDRLPLETGLILSQELVEMMEEYPVEDGPLRTSRDEPSARHSPVAYIYGRVRRKVDPRAKPGAPAAVGDGRLPPWQENDLKRK